MDIFFELHTNLPREGPGDNESIIKTLKKKYKRKRGIITTLENEMEEIRIFEKYNSYYIQVFYVVQII